MTRLDRRALFASGAAAALLAASGVSAQTSPRFGGHFRGGLSGANRADTWEMPYGPANFMMAAARSAVFDRLTEVGCDGSLVGELATGWTGNADATVWDFDLRDNAVFHSGKPFVSDDVIDSLRYHAKVMVLGIHRLKRVSDHKVTIELSSGNANFPMLMSHPQLIMLPAGTAGGVGTGLYQVHKFDPGRHFIGHRAARHYKADRAGWFETVEFVSLPSSVVRTTALLEGLVDAVDNFDTSQRDMLEQRPDLRITGTDAHCAEIMLPAQSNLVLARDNTRLAERWWRS